MQKLKVNVSKSKEVISEKEESKVTDSEDPYKIKIKQQKE